jgi:hypothetical protein
MPTGLHGRPLALFLAAFSYTPAESRDRADGLMGARRHSLRVVFGEPAAVA